MAAGKKNSLTDVEGIIVGHFTDVRPAHTMFDGDTIFCLATNKKELPDIPGFFAAPKAMTVNEIGRAAADCMTRAIIRAILAATSSNSMVAFRDLQTR